MEKIRKLFLFFWRQRIFVNISVYVCFLLSFLFHPVLYFTFAFLVFELAVVLYGAHKKWYL